jgi:hypothetical protein
MMEAVRTSETLVDNHFTRQYTPEDNSEHHTRRRWELEISRGYITSRTCMHTSAAFPHFWIVVVSWFNNVNTQDSQKYDCVRNSALSKYSETSIHRFWVAERTAKSERWKRENDSCGKVVYMGDAQGPEKVNNLFVKTMHAGTIDCVFTV